MSREYTNWKLGYVEGRVKKIYPKQAQPEGKQVREQQQRARLSEAIASDTNASASD